MTKVCVFGLGGESPELFYVPGPVYRLESMPELRRQIVEAGEKVEIVKRMALADSDLKALWDRVRAW